MLRFSKSRPGALAVTTSGGDGTVMNYLIDVLERGAVEGVAGDSGASVQFDSLEDLIMAGKPFRKVYDNNGGSAPKKVAFSKHSSVGCGK